MKKILFTNQIGTRDEHKQRMLMLEDLGYKVYFEKESSLEFKPYMKDVEVMVCFRPFERLNIEDLPALKWIQITSMGFEQVPEEELAKRNIIVTNNRGGYSIPMGEWVVLNILELVKNRKSAYENQAAKKWWMDRLVTEVYKKKVAFIGTGDIAKESIKRLQGFEIETLGVNTNGRSIPGFDQCFSLDQLDQVLEQSDVVVISLPHTDLTQHLFNKARLDQMKEDACLINVSRGAIIKEEDLIKHLEEGKLKGVALDVFETEPLPRDNKLWDFDRVVITAHNSWISEETEERKWQVIYENAKRHIKGDDLLNQVEISKGY